jgi:hypothetical protein
MYSACAVLREWKLIIGAQTNARYMVDVNTYRQLHGWKDDSSTANAAQDYLDPEIIDWDIPPPGHFSLLLPPTILGFGFHDKTWST